MRRSLAFAIAAFFAVGVTALACADAPVEANGEPTAPAPTTTTDEGSTIPEPSNPSSDPKDAGEKDAGKQQQPPDAGRRDSGNPNNNSAACDLEGNVLKTAAYTLRAQNTDPPIPCPCKANECCFLAVPPLIAETCIVSAFP